MKNFRLTMAVLLTILLGFGSFVACELDENKEETPNTGDNNNNHDDDNNNGGNEQPVYADVKYIRVDDISKVTPKDEDPGADIDAIAVRKKDTNALVVADDVVGYRYGSEGGADAGKNSAFKTDNVKTIDAFWDYANNGVKDKCHLNTAEKTDARTYLSLGGLGGYLIVGLPGEEKIEVGDKIVVFEVGNCEMTNCKDSTGKCGNATNDPVKIQISASPQYDGGHWQLVGEAQGNITEMGVTKIPQVLVSDLQQD